MISLDLLCIWKSAQSGTLKEDYTVSLRLKLRGIHTRSHSSAPTKNRGGFWRPNNFANSASFSLLIPSFFPIILQRLFCVFPTNLLCFSNESFVFFQRIFCVFFQRIFCVCLPDCREFDPPGYFFRGNTILLSKFCFASFVGPPRPSTVSGGVTDRDA